MALEQLNQTGPLIRSEEILPTTKEQAEVLRRSVDLRLQRLVKLTQHIETLLSNQDSANIG
jgi:hypothetical protein